MSGCPFVFIGVTTASSSIMRIFPRWRDLLGLGSDIELVGVDLPLHAPVERYRETIAAIKGDLRTVGGLVTTHKIDLYQAARDLFDELDDYAALLGEVSCLAKRDGRLRGRATDPISAGRTLEGMLGPQYFARSGGHVLCFGAGGAGQAITLCLLSRATDRPARVTLTDLDRERLRSVEALLRRLGAEDTVELIRSGDPAVNDRLVSRLPPGSLIVNATGMGKDRPGSPLTAQAHFPEQSIAWDLNYRGELDFLSQAQAQAERRNVRVEDGWQYFIYGWAAVMEAVFDRPIAAEDLQKMAQEAAFARPVSPIHAVAKR